MNEEILRRLIRIEGKLDDLEKIAERVRKLELWQSWLRGAWAALLAAYLYLFKTIH